MIFVKCDQCHGSGICYGTDCDECDGRGQVLETFDQDGGDDMGQEPAVAVRDGSCR